MVTSDWQCGHTTRTMTALHFEGGYFLKFAEDYFFTETGHNHPQWLQQRCQSIFHSDTLDEACAHGS